MVDSGQPFSLVAMEVPNQGWVQDLAPGDPTPLLWAVPLPVHQVLYAPASMPTVKNAVNLVSWCIVDHARGWGDRGNQRTMDDRFDAGGVKSGVNAHGPG